VVLPLLNVLQHLLLAGALVVILGLAAALGRVAFALIGR
jgi:hypothetical protein